MQFRLPVEEAILHDSRVLIAQVEDELAFAHHLQTESQVSLTLTRDLLTRSNGIIAATRKLLAAQRLPSNDN
jgi:hypothetical protein